MFHKSPTLCRTTTVGIIICFALLKIVIIKMRNNKTNPKNSFVSCEIPGMAANATGFTQFGHL